MKQFVLITEIRKEAMDVEWWMDQTNTEITTQIFDTFSEAKSQMRKTVKGVCTRCDFFPMERKQYVPIVEVLKESEDESLSLLSDVISETICNPTFELPEGPFAYDVDNANHYFAFVGTQDIVLVDYYSKLLRFNIHNMDKSSKCYFFEYKELDEDGITENSIIVKLLPTGKKRIKTSKIENNLAPAFETITFGKYYQRNTEEMTPISWYILEKSDDEAFLISEYILDLAQFGDSGNNKWKESYIRTWLNTDFYDEAFNEMEKASIIERTKGERVSLITLEEYTKYYTIDERIGRARYTDFSRAKTEKHYRTKIREPYGFWWTRTANVRGGWGEDGSVYVYHICNDGIDNEFERSEYSDGVRPVIRIDLSAMKSEING